MRTLEEALASIPVRRDTLNQMDDDLSDVIRHVERVLCDLHPGVQSEVTYETPGGRFVLSFDKCAGRWRILWGHDEDDFVDTPLESTNRFTRAEVFVVGASGQMPIERLVVSVAESLAQATQERSSQLDAARRLSAALVAAGFPNTK